LYNKNNLLLESPYFYSIPLLIDALAGGFALRVRPLLTDALAGGFALRVRPLLIDALAGGLALRVRPLLVPDPDVLGVVLPPPLLAVVPLLLQLHLPFFSLEVKKDVQLSFFQEMFLRKRKKC
jgi:hypothetical protein